MLTGNQKVIFIELLEGRFLMKRGNMSGGLSFALYRDNMVLLRKADVSKDLRGLLKQDKKGRYHLSRSQIRSLHGKSWAKQEYKKHLKKKQDENI